MSIQALRELFNRDACAEVRSHEGSDTGTVILSERGSGAQSDYYEFTIKGVPSTSLIVNLDDNFPAPSSIFQGSNGECRRSDYLIFSDFDDQFYAIFVEMKKTGRNHANSNIVSQLRGGECFFGYCCALLEGFWNAPRLSITGGLRFASIRDVHIHKRPTRSNGLVELHDRPERMKKISGKSTHFKNLIHPG